MASLPKVGCGSGGSGEQINPTTAVDFSEEMVKVTKTRLPDTECSVADAHDLPFRDNSYSTVFSRSVIQHCMYPDVVVGEFVRVAFNNVIIMTNIFPKYTFSIDENKMIIHHFDKEYLIDIFNSYDYTLNIIGRTSIIVINV